MTRRRSSLCSGWPGTTARFPDSRRAMAASGLSRRSPARDRPGPWHFMQRSKIGRMSPSKLTAVAAVSAARTCALVRGSDRKTFSPHTSRRLVVSCQPFMENTAARCRIARVQRDAGLQRSASGWERRRGRQEGMALAWIYSTTASAACLSGSGSFPPTRACLEAHESVTKPGGIRLFLSQWCRQASLRAARVR